MLRSIMIGAASIAATAPAMAGGLDGSYVGPAIAVGTNSQGAAASLVGRVEAGNLPLSIRPQVTVNTQVEGAIGATYDLAVAENTNLYLGGGAAFGEAGILTFENSTVGYIQAGAETQLAEHAVVFADVKVALTDGTSVVPTVGLAWKF